MRTNRVKRALREGKPSVGTWLSLGNVLAARFLARAGFDWLNVDIEHSMVGMETTSAIFGAVADAGCTILARVPCNRHDHIKRVLDNGAHGVVVPMVNTRTRPRQPFRRCYIRPWVRGQLAAAPTPSTSTPPQATTTPRRTTNC